MCHSLPCVTSAKCPWRQRTSGVILPLLPLIYYRLTAPKVGHKVDARTLEAIGNADGKLTHDVRYFSSFRFEIHMFYIHIYIYIFCRTYTVLPTAIGEQQQQSQQCRRKANTFATITLSAWPQMEWALFRSDNAKEHHIAGGQIRIFGLPSQASGQQDGEFSQEQAHWSSRYRISINTNHEMAI